MGKMKTLLQSYVNGGEFCPEISCSVFWSCMQFVTCSIPKLQMDAVLPENK